MSVETLVGAALAMEASDFASRVSSIREYSKQVEILLETLAETGIKIQISQWSLKYQTPFEVKRSDLPALRKAIGSLRVDGKNAAYDFNETNEVVVSVKPTNKAFDKIAFKYRSPFRAGGKCHVETSVSTNTYLVCRV